VRWLKRLRSGDPDWKKLCSWVVVVVVVVSVVVVSEAELVSKIAEAESVYSKMVDATQERASRLAKALFVGCSSSSCSSGSCCGSICRRCISEAELVSKLAEAESIYTEMVEATQERGPD